MWFLKECYDVTGISYKKLILEENMVQTDEYS